MNRESTSPKNEDLSLRDYAIVSNPEYWRGKESELKSLIDKASLEIREIEKSAQREWLPGNAEEAKKIKAIWVLSGAGTYKKTITDDPGDLANIGKYWIHGSDRKRIGHAADLIKKISLIASGNCLPKEVNSYKISDVEVLALVKEYGPYLIYNGTAVQNADLIAAIKDDSLLMPEEKLFIPESKITKTIDQVKMLKFPDINFEKNDEIGIVSHAPHLARVMRMVNKYKPIPEGVEVQLYPLVFGDPENEREFAQSEMKGIVGYVSKGLATAESSYSYLLAPRA